jgi:hypothetical protein
MFFSTIGLPCLGASIRSSLAGRPEMHMGGSLLPRAAPHRKWKHGVNNVTPSMKKNVKVWVMSLDEEECPHMYKVIEPIWHVC